MVIQAPAWGLLNLFMIFSFVFLVAWQVVFRSTLGPALRKVGNVGFGGVRGIGAIHPLRFLVRTADAIDAATARGIQGSERGIVYSFNKFVDTAAIFIGVPLAIALGLLELAQYVKTQVGHAVTRVEHTTVVKKIGSTTKVITEVSRAQFRSLTHRVDALRARVNHLAHAGAGAIALPFPRIGRLEKTAKAQAKRLTRLEKRVFGAVAAGFGVAILAKAVIGWLRCPSVSRAMRKRNCIDFDFLDALLTGALLIVGTISLVEFAEEVQSVTEEASGLIHGFLRDA